MDAGARTYGKVAGVPTSKGGEQHMEDLRSLAEAAGALLKERGQTVAVVESSAGGLVSAALLAAPGASAYFVGGAVVYTRAAQRGLLRVPDEAMEGLRASTEGYALLNARTALELLAPLGALRKRAPAGRRGTVTETARDTPASRWRGRSRRRSPWRPESPTASETCGRLPRRRSICWSSVSRTPVRSEAVTNA